MCASTSSKTRRLELAKTLQVQYFERFLKLLTSKLPVDIEAAAEQKRMSDLYFDMFIYYSTTVRKFEGESFDHLSQLLEIASNEFVNNVTNITDEKTPLFWW